MPHVYATALPSPVSGFDISNLSAIECQVLLRHNVTDARPVAQQYPGLAWVPFLWETLDALGLHNPGKP